MSKQHLRNDMKQFTFLNSKSILRRMHVFRNFLLWQCQFQCKQSCQKLVHNHAHTELFCNVSLHGERTQCSIAIVFFAVSA